MNNNQGNNTILSRTIKTHNLSKINNKSSSCITPGYFNPFINYKTKERISGNKKMDITNKNIDHFYHMNPTEFYKYKPLLKRTKINYNSSQITSLPGNVKKINIKEQKKTGKKLFEINNEESDLISQIRSRNKIKNKFNITNNSMIKKTKKYEFDAPIVSFRDMENKKK